MFVTLMLSKSKSSKLFAYLISIGPIQLQKSINIHVPVEG